ncbi:MAG: hypothetical protein ACYDAB_10895 [bacterium]
MDAERVHAEQEVGQKFFANVEGTDYPWARDTITVTEIRHLGNIPADVPVLEESPEGTERTLPENEIVTLKPGHRHGRAAKYRRG